MIHLHIESNLAHRLSKHTNITPLSIIACKIKNKQTDIQKPKQAPHKITQPFYKCILQQDRTTLLQNTILIPTKSSTKHYSCNDHLHIYILIIEPFSQISTARIGKNYDYIIIGRKLFGILIYRMSNGTT